MIAVALIVVGVLLSVAGVAMVSLPAALIVGGVVITVFGVMLDLSSGGEQ
jgi:hypothetical protein